MRPGRFIRVAQDGTGMAIFQSARGHLHYEALGSGQPILLLHGFTNYGLGWAPQLAALVHSGYHVIVPDLRGHGASASATAPSTVPDLAGDITALLDHLAVGPVTVCGLSLGGMVAMEMALARRDCLAGLIVANSTASFSGPERTAVVAGWTTLLRQADGPVKRLEATWRTLVNEDFRDSAAGRACHDAWATVLRRVSGVSLCHVAEGMTQFDVRGRLATITAPTLVIGGEHDLLFGLDGGRAIASEVPDAEFTVIPGAGHISSLDSADHFNRLVLAFLADRVRPT
jgi:3-oxoadipate enol-lactonase